MSGRQPFAIAVACLILSAAGAAFAEEDAAPAEAAGAARPAPFADGLDDAPLTSKAFDATPTGRHADIGAAFIFVSPITNSLEDRPPSLRYDPGIGVAASGRIVILPYLHAGIVFSYAVHGIDADSDALGVRGGLTAESLVAYRLEAHVLPTLPLGDRVRLFAILGLGWGRLELGPMTGRDDDGTFVVRGRGASYFDVPVGLGASIELVPKWLSLDAMFSGAPTFAKKGTAHTAIQAFDGAGQPVDVGPLPQVPVWFVQSLGVSLLL